MNKILVLSLCPFILSCTSYAAESSAFPLHVAAFNGSVAQVTALLDGGADVNQKNKHGGIAFRGFISHGETALHYATQCGHQDVVQLLIACGAKVRKNCRGETALHYAALYGHQGIARLLIAHDANVAQRNIFGMSPLHFASVNGHHEVAKLLLRCGANVDVASHNAATPLHVAAEKGQQGIVQLLLASGANVNCQIKCEYRGWANPVYYNGFTPLHYAAFRGDQGIAQLLLAYGANVNLRHAHGTTPLQIAEERGKVGIAHLITSWSDFIEGLRSTFVTFASGMHARCGKNSAVHILCPQVICLMCSYLSPKTCLYPICEIDGYVARFKNCRQLLNEKCQKCVRECPICCEDEDAEVTGEFVYTQCCKQYLCRTCIAKLIALEQPCPLCRNAKEWFGH